MRTRLMVVVMLASGYLLGACNNPIAPPAPHLTVPVQKPEAVPLALLLPDTLH